MKRFFHRLKNFLQFKVALLADKIRGVDFMRPVDLSTVGIQEQKYYRSSASGKDLLDIFKTLNVSTKDKIIDIGCGKGRAINLLSSFSFSKIDGIELSDLIAQTARDNFAKLKKRNITIHTGNALEFSGYENYTMFYLYNPFSCEVMEQLMNKLAPIFAASKERKTLIYRNPTCSATIDKYTAAGGGQLFLVNKIVGINAWETTYIYSNIKD